MSDILKIEDLVIQYDTDSGCVHALNGLSLTLREGETLGLVGETGAGKTTLARSIMGLIQCPPGKIVSGKILYRGEDLLAMKEKHRQSIRGKEISMIFQDPMTSLNPVTTVGDQIAEAVKDIPAKLKVAVMGCVVNGPGEAKDADIGIAGGDGCAVLFRKGEVIRRIPEDQIIPVLLGEIKRLI